MQHQDLFKKMLRNNIVNKIDAPITDAVLETFAAIFEARVVQKGEFLLHRDEVATHTFFVVSGCLKMFTVDPNGGEHVVQFASEDWWITDVKSLANQTPASFCIQAIEKSVVFAMDETKTQAVYDQCPQVESYFRILSMRRFIALQDRVYQEHTRLAEDRYLDFVDKFPQLSQRVPQHDIASYLGIKPQSLSRIRKNIYKKKH